MGPICLMADRCLLLERVIGAVEVEERCVRSDACTVDFGEENSVVAAIVGRLDAAHEGGQAIVQERNAKRTDRVGQVGDPVAVLTTQTGAALGQLLLAGVEDVDAAYETLSAKDVRFLRPPTDQPS